MRRWRKHCERKLERLEAITEAAHKYVREHFQDRPGSKGVVDQVDYYSDAAGICLMVSRESGGWAEDYILDMSLKRLFQYVKAIQDFHGKKVLFNPSDRIIGDWLTQQNALNQQSAATN